MHIFCVDQSMVVPIGLYGDGVPCKAKMRDSLEQFSWSFCCQPQAPRVVYTAIHKSALVGKRTWDAILQVFSWSMRYMLSGKWPAKTHEGTQIATEG